MFLLFCSEVWQVLLPESFSYRLRNCLYGYLWRDSFQESLPAVRECLILLQDNISQILGKWAGGLVPLRRQVFCKDENPFYRLVEAMNDRKIRFAWFCPVKFTWRKKMVFEQAFHVGSSDMTALSRRSCGFMADDDLLVFVYNKRGCIFIICLIFAPSYYWLFNVLRLNWLSYKRIFRSTL